MGYALRAHAEPQDTPAQRCLADASAAGAEFDGGTKFDTSIAGNHNTGHEFNDGPVSNGVIGRKLTPDERLALIEFLKTQ